MPEEPTPRQMFKRGFDVRKRSSSRRKKRKRAPASINRGLKTSLVGSGTKNTPLSKTLKVNMKYQAAKNLNPTVGGIIALNNFSANGMYDPDVTGVGHQPRGFDQFVGVLYDHYTVIASSIQVTFSNSDTTNPQVCGIMVSDQSTSPTTLNNALESPDCIYTVVGARDSGSSVQTLRRSINPNKWLGFSHPMSQPQARGSAGGNPAEDIFFQVFVGAMDEGTDSGDVVCQIVINYTAILSEPRNPAQS